MSDFDDAEVQPVDTLNKFLVAVNGETILLMNPPRVPISKADALLLAAYLVTLADDDELGPRFPGVLKAVQNT